MFFLQKCATIHNVVIFILAKISIGVEFLFQFLLPKKKPNAPVLVDMMATDEVIQAKIYRLEELRKYQAHYGPNTPYPVVAEINQLEAELQRILKVDATRRTRIVKKKDPVPIWQIWKMSQATIDLIATISFIGLVFLLGAIIFAAYVQTRPGNAAAYNNFSGDGGPTATRRPTFTPTVNPNGEPVSEVDNVTMPVADASGSFLPTPGSHATDIPTPVPTMTPTLTPEVSATPLPTDTPVPTNTPRPRPTATPAPPTPIPPPSFPFAVTEQGNRMFQSTSYHVITIYIAVVSNGNIPVGGYKVVGDHTPSGQHAESGISTWNWDVTNCLNCDYIKQGNLKFEPGSFADGVWNIYLADENGTRLSETLSLPYSSDPNQWVWDFIIFKQK